jgi:hypothetical protein
MPEGDAALVSACSSNPHASDDDKSMRNLKITPIRAWATTLPRFLDNNNVIARLTAARMISE